jgi:hypothetical protein
MGAPNPQHFKYSDIKDKVLHLAQTSVYLVDVTSGVNQSIKNFMRQRNLTLNANEALSLRLLCCDASLPGSGMDTHEATGDYHGVTEKMVYRRIYDDTIDLTFYVDYQYKVMDFFESWFNYCVGEGSTFSQQDYKLPNAYYRMNYPDSYKCDIFLTKFEKREAIAQPAVKYTFIDAFPSNISSIPISYSGSEILKVTVSFSYTRYIRETGMERVPTEFTGDLKPTEQAKVNKPEPSSLSSPPVRNDAVGVVRTNEYYNNFGDNRQNSTNFADFTNGSNGGPFGQAVG